MHDAALPAGCRVKLRKILDQAQALVGDKKQHPAQAPLLQMPQKRGPALAVLRGAFDRAQRLAITPLVHADRHRHGDVLDLAAPASLQPDAVEVNLGALVLDRPGAPLLDAGIDHLVLLADRARAYPGSPQGFRGVFRPAHARARQVHLHQCFLHRALPLAIPVNDRRLKRQRPQLR